MGIEAVIGEFECPGFRSRRDKRGERDEDGRAGKLEAQSRKRLLLASSLIRLSMISRMEAHWHESTCWPVVEGGRQMKEDDGPWGTVGIPVHEANVLLPVDVG